MLESAAFTLAMSARATSTLPESASWAHPGLTKRLRQRGICIHIED